MREPSRTVGERGYVRRPPPSAAWAVRGRGGAGGPRLSLYPGRGTGGVKKHRVVTSLARGQSRLVPPPFRGGDLFYTVLPVSRVLLECSWLCVILLKLIFSAYLEAYWRYAGVTMGLHWRYNGEIHRGSIGFALGLHWITPEGGVVHARGGSVTARWRAPRRVALTE